MGGVAGVEGLHQASPVNHLACLTRQKVRVPPQKGVGTLANRILVCGGRGFNDAAGAHRVLDAMHRVLGIDAVIEGDARGADRIAGLWARKNGVTNLKFPANWTAHGKAAGPIRNQRMLDEGRPSHVLAFPGGAGTADMVRRAKSAGIEIVRVAAQGIEAATAAETVKLGSVHESPVGEADAPERCSEHSIHSSSGRG